MVPGCLPINFQREKQITTLYEKCPFCNTCTHILKNKLLIVFYFLLNIKQYAPSNNKLKEKKIHLHLWYFAMTFYCYDIVKYYNKWNIIWKTNSRKLIDILELLFKLNCLSSKINYMFVLSLFTVHDVKGVHWLC